MWLVELCINSWDHCWRLKCCRIALVRHLVLDGWRIILRLPLLNSFVYLIDRPALLHNFWLATEVLQDANHDSGVCTLTIYSFCFGCSQIVACCLETTLWRTKTTHSGLQFYSDEKQPSSVVVRRAVIATFSGLSESWVGSNSNRLHVKPCGRWPP